VPDADVSGLKRPEVAAREIAEMIAAALPSAAASQAAAPPRVAAASQAAAASHATTGEPATAPSLEIA
jgi:hypothetical protein